MYVHYGSTCITDVHVLRITHPLRLFAINLSWGVRVLRVQHFLCRVQYVYLCMITGADSCLSSSPCKATASLLSSQLIMHVFDVRFLLHVTSPPLPIHLSVRKNHHSNPLGSQRKGPFTRTVSFPISVYVTVNLTLMGRMGSKWSVTIATMVKF